MRPRTIRPLISRLLLSRLLLSGMVLAVGGLGCGGCQPEAQAAGLTIGVGTPFGKTGLNLGTSYRFGNWNDRWQTGLYLDAGRYVNRARKKSGQKQPEFNVDLRVSPRDSHVYLNGTRVPVQGGGELMLPPGTYRMEFVRGGYRSDVSELRVQPGVEYRVERKLSRLQKGEVPDPRTLSPQEPRPIAEAVKATAPVVGVPAVPTPNP